jgi:hypothetical protein
MVARPPRRLRIAQGLVEREAALLLGRPVVAVAHRPVGCQNSGRAGGIGLPRAPEYVPRELVEQKHQGERALG